MKKLFTTFATVAAMTTMSQAQIVINEIMYNVAGAGEDEEYVELYNTGATSFDLTGYTLADNAGDITFNGVTVPAGGYLVVAKDSAKFMDAFGMNADQIWTGNLSNGGEYITLKDASGTLADSVSYDNASPWPDVVAMSGKSYAIQLCDAATDNNVGSNWGIANNYIGLNGQTGVDSLFGTPGMMNSCYTPPAVTYTLETIANARNTDANGLPTNLNNAYELRGVVHCSNFSGSGLDFKLIDAQNNGVTVYKSSVIDNYTVTAGDSLHVWGTVANYNGLVQFSPDSIAVMSSGNSLVMAMEVTAVTEMAEGKHIVFKNAYLVDTTAWIAGSNMNLQVTNGTDTVLARFDRDMMISGGAVLTGTYNIYGTGGQYDNSNPYTEGYQLMVCDAVSTTASSTTKIADAASVNIYPNPARTTLNVVSADVVTAATVYNMMGQSVITVNNINNTNFTINTANLENGIYTVSFVAGDKLIVKQFSVIK